MKKIVMMYRDQLLPYSETFIPTQVESLQSYTGFYVGTSRTPEGNSLIPQSRSSTLSDVVSKPEIWKMAFKLTHTVHPRWFKILQELSPSIVHAHFGLDGIWGMILAQKLNIPLVVTFRGSDITGMESSRPENERLKLNDFIWRRGQFFRDLYLKRRDRLFSTAHYCFAVSDFLRSKLVEKGCPPEKAIVLYTGVNLEKFTPDLHIPVEPVVLFVGRLVEKKGCEYLIRAMAKVQLELPEAELVVIGDGPLSSRLKALAADSLKRYRFLGSQPHEVVKSWMNRAALLSLPSITAKSGDSEGLPNVVVEAQAMRLPVVASIHAGIPEAVLHNETGLLAAEKDWEALGQNILAILKNPEVRERFASSGRIHVEKKFNLHRNTAKLEEFYSSILSESLSCS